MIELQWAVHNLVIHPLAEIAYWVTGLNKNIFWKVHGVWLPKGHNAKTTQGSSRHA